MRLIEVIQDENGKLSSTRIITLLFALGGIGIGITEVFLLQKNIDVGELNILVGILVSAAVGNKFVGSFTKGQNTNVDSQRS